MKIGSKVSIHMLKLTGQTWPQSKEIYGCFPFYLLKCPFLGFKIDFSIYYAQLYILHLFQIDLIVSKVHLNEVLCICWVLLYIRQGGMGILSHNAPSLILHAFRRPWFVKKYCMLGPIISPKPYGVVNWTCKADCQILLLVPSSVTFIVPIGH